MVVSRGISCDAKLLGDKILWLLLCNQCDALFFWCKLTPASVCFVCPPPRRSRLTVITVRHNNGSSCSAGGQRSHCAIRPSQAMADLRSQSSVALDKPRRKETKLWLSDHFRKDKPGQTCWTFSRKQNDKNEKGLQSRMGQKCKCQSRAFVCESVLNGWRRY